MHGVIQRLHEAGHLSGEEAADAHAIERAGSADFMIGYELEVMPEAVPDIRLLDDRIKRITQFGHPSVEKCVEVVHELGFKTSDDALFEINSPRARHPVSLAIATRGMGRAGVLPEPGHTTEGVTAHVNLGCRRTIPRGSELHYKAIRLLRATELLGGATRSRLIDHIEDPTLAEYTWSEKGLAGVYLDVNKTRAKPTRWKGRFQRDENRSLEFIDSEQFGRTLEFMYYFGRGLLDKNKALNRIYEHFDTQFRAYQAVHDLPNLPETLPKKSRSDTFIENSIVLKTEDGFLAYMGPYARHIDLYDTCDLALIAHETIQEIREALGMSDLPSLLRAPVESY